MTSEQDKLLVAVCDRLDDALASKDASIALPLIFKRIQKT